MWRQDRYQMLRWFDWTIAQLRAVSLYFVPSVAMAVLQYNLQSTRYLECILVLINYRIQGEVQSKNVKSPYKYFQTGQKSVSMKIYF